MQKIKNTATISNEKKNHTAYLRAFTCPDTRKKSGNPGFRRQDMLDYHIIYSKRKTIALCVDRIGQVIVRAPLRMPEEDIHAFVAQHRDWVEAQRRKMQNLPVPEVLTDAEIMALREKAKAYLPSRVSFYSKQMGLFPTGVKITSARSRWGSCSGKNSLCFSFRLMLLPDDLMDYVIVHELAHIKEKNHSARFYAVVAEYLPDYKQRISALKAISPTLPI